MLVEILLLFRALDGQKKNKGIYDHKNFIKAIKKGNALFENDEN